MLSVAESGSRWFDHSTRSEKLRRLVPEHRLQQSRAALRGFDEALSLLVERRPVEDVQFDTGHARHDQRHDQNQREDSPATAQRLSPET
jgi:hypothetical protein